MSTPDPYRQYALTITQDGRGGTVIRCVEWDLGRSSYPHYVSELRYPGVQFPSSRGPLEALGVALQRLSAEM